MPEITADLLDVAASYYCTVLGTDAVGTEGSVLVVAMVGVLLLDVFVALESHAAPCIAAISPFARRSIRSLTRPLPHF